MQLHLFLILHVQTAFMFIRDTFFSINSQNCLMNEKIRDETLGKRICIIMKLMMKWHAGSTVGKVNVHIIAKEGKRVSCLMLQRLCKWSYLNIY